RQAERLNGVSASASAPAGSVPLVVGAQDPDHHTLDLAAIRFDDSRFHRLVRRLQADFAAFLVEPLQSCLAGIEQSNYLLAIAGIFPPLDDHVIAIHQV